jgi:apolipoprotein D and lipocalin family protein
MMKPLFTVLPVLLVAGLAQGWEKPSQPLRVVPAVDLERYMGSWYEIARLPNRFQKECAGEVLATYTLRDDGRIDVLNQCRKHDGEIQRAEGVARLADESGLNSKLEVRFAPSFLSFLPFVWGKYWVLALAPDYRYAVVGEPDRKFLWILSRTPQMDDATYQEIVARLADLGYDTGRLTRTRQRTDIE